MQLLIGCHAADSIDQSEYSRIWVLQPPQMTGGRSNRFENDVI